jgi:uncharacterized protein (TIRG00374 family)
MKAARTTLRALKLLALPLVLGALLLVLRHIGFDRIVAAARRMDRPTIAVAAALHMTVFVLWCLRWQQLMRPENRKSIFALLPIYMAGVFGNVVTPGARVGGEPIRAYYMSRAFGGQKTAHLGTILTDKVSNGVVFLLFLLVSVSFVVLFVGISLTSKLVMLVVVLLVVAGFSALVLLRGHVKGAFLSLSKLLPLIYASRPMRFLRSQFASCEEFENYLAEKMRNVFGPMARTAGSSMTLAKVLSLSAGAWLLFCLAHYVLFRSLGADVGFLRVMIIVTISTFFGDVSISPGGAGFMETAMIGLCAAFGVEPGAAAAVTLISRVLFYAYGLGAGGLCLVGLSLRYGRAEDGQAAPREMPGART